MNKLEEENCKMKEIISKLSETDNVAPQDKSPPDDFIISDSES